MGTEVEQTAIRELENRLSLLASDTSDPGELWRRSLLRSSSAQRRSWPLRLSAALAVMVIGALSLYFCPAEGAVLARTPGVGKAFVALAQTSGLGVFAESAEALSSADVQNGRRINLVGGYADGNQTVLFLQVPAGDNVVDGYLADQFGRQYKLRSIATISNGDTVVAGEPFGWPDPAIGVRLTLTVTALEVSPGVVDRGSWRLHGLLFPATTQVHSINKAVAVGSERFTIDKIERSGKSLALSMVLSGPRTASDPSPVDLARALVLVSRDGHEQSPFYASASSQPNHLELHAIWAATAEGDHNLKITLFGLTEELRFSG